MKRELKELRELKMKMLLNKINKKITDFFRIRFRTLRIFWGKKINRPLLETGRRVCMSLSMIGQKCVEKKLDIFFKISTNW